MPLESNNCVLFPLITQALVEVSSLKKFSKNPDLPAGYRPVVLAQRDLDRCDVCHMDEVRHSPAFLVDLADFVLYTFV